uniref:Transcription elongation factor A protein 2 n=1 Tax=Anthurium amnicola TaxID=1678845 RepID=A0A1D1ZLJ1_9ARAE
MCPAIAPGAAGTTTAASPPHPLPSPVSTTINSQHPSPDFFLKDGRKFCVGDCALFQAGSSPPFIGIIRWFTPDKEEYFKLGVNWLYRPSDIKLAKGIVLKAAPNEVFYSFRTVETSAGLLLHPCKVSFLHKGVELPSGVSSFVCWRVYDTTNKCLWWLNETDYIDGRQEVDQLLEKTQIEMHAALQPGGRSPKQLSGHLSSQKLNSSSDSIQNSSIQNSSISVTSHTRSKKRGEKGDQGSESMKRERSSKADDGDSGHFRLDSMIKAEIAKITDKGGLTNNDAVEKLVQLMQLDRGERKIDLAGRVLLADVITATDRNDCLGRFVHLRGVPLLDDWLQEAHKGKIGDGTSPKEGDKSVEDLLLALLRALDKLPVNLNALQTCNIGKSVNHLRSHKNSEIQKKARCLVDAWKKRVDAEMIKLEMAKLNEIKSAGSNQAVSWPGKPGFSGVSYVGNKRAASGEATVKNVVTQTQPSICKSLPVKIGHGDSILRSNPAPLGSLKLPSTLSTSVAVGTKDPQSKAGGSSGAAESSMTTIKEEKINSSSQPQNNSQPCSSDLPKTMGSSCKEDARSSTTGTMTASKTSGGSSRHRKTSNSFVGSGVSGIQKDAGSSRSNSQHRSTAFEKTSQSGLTSERTVDSLVADHGTHRLVVRFPNPVRSPARSAGGGSPEEPLVAGSRAAFLGTSEKNDHIDRKVKVKTDVCRANFAADVKTELWQNDDVKCVAGSDDGGRSTDLLDEDYSRSSDDTRKTVNALRATCSSAERGTLLAETKSGKSFQASLSSINALIDASVSVSGGDDLGMNLLASVAAGEMSKSDLASPTGSPGRNMTAAEEPCTVDEFKPKFSSDDVVTQSPRQPKDSPEVDSSKHEAIAVPLKVRGEVLQTDADSMTDSFADNRSVEPSQEKELTGEHKEQYPVSAAVSCDADPITKSGSKTYDAAADVHAPLLTLPADIKEERSEDCSVNQLREKRKASGSVTDGLPECKRKARNTSSDGIESVDSVHEKTMEGNMSLGGGSDVDHFVSNSRKHEDSVEERSLDKQNVADEGLHDVIPAEQQVPPVLSVCPEDVCRNVDNAVAASNSTNTCPQIVVESRTEKSGAMAAKSQLELSDHEKKDHINHTIPTLDDEVGSSVFSTSNGTEESLDKEVVKQNSHSPPSHEPPPLTTCETEQCEKSRGSLYGAEEDKMGEVPCSVEASPALISSAPPISSKINFDLNEGFSGEDGNTVLPVISNVPGCSSALHLPNMSHFTVSSMSSSSPVSITVAAPAKGPFVPPETLLKSKGEPGWKGSAATSAFRPAEPRKVLDMTLGTAEAQSSDGAADKECRLPLDIDLNVADERVLEDISSQSSVKEVGRQLGFIGNHDALIRSSGGLDLDLNMTDESIENGEISASTIRRSDVTPLPVRSASGRFPNGVACVSRDFDLNNGPGLDEVGMEHINRGQLTKGSTVPFLPSLRMNNSELGNRSSWFPSGNSYPAVAIPSFLPDRGDQPYPVVAAPGAQRMFGSATVSDLYRGPVLSSSPAMAFTPAAAFPYAGFPFGSSFPLASTSFSGGSTAYVDSASGGGPCFPAVPTPLMGPAGAASAPCVRPYLLNLPEGSTSANSVNIRKWGWQGLDLNTGPGSVDVEGRDERLPLTSRQLSVASSQAFAEEQARIYQAAGGVLKRKDPEGGWDVEKLTHRQPSWQ